MSSTENDEQTNACFYYVPPIVDSDSNLCKSNPEANFYTVQNSFHSSNRNVTKPANSSPLFTVIPNRTHDSSKTNYSVGYQIEDSFKQSIKTKNIFKIFFSLSIFRFKAITTLDQRWPCCQR